MNYAQNGWRYDNRVTAMMVEDMLFDPILGAKVLLGLEVPPHMELRLLTMWTKHFTNDDSGFSTGKSFTAAVVAALRSILMPGRISGVLSGTFRQGQLIFQNFDRWHESSKIFRSCVKYSQGKPKLIHSSALWQAFFRGGSEVRVLPPNFVQDSERLRSERWHDGYMDEWTTFGNFGALTKTIFGRITATNHFQNCPVRQNHIHLMSTPGFTYQPAYKIVKQIQAQVQVGNEDYGRFTSNYRHVPKTPQWNWLLNRKMIFSMQTMNPPGVVASEVDGLWQQDSMSYYSSKAINDRRVHYAPKTKRSSDQEIFVCAFDTARGSGRGRHTGDDFSAVVWEIGKKDEPNRPVFMVRKHGATTEQMSGVIHQLHRWFHLSMIMYDPGGGGLFVRDELRKTSQVIDNQEEFCEPIIELDDTTGTMGDMILVPFRRSALYIARMWGKMASDSVLLNRAHKAFKSAIENKTVILPSEWNGWQKFEGFTGEPDSKRAILNMRSGALKGADLVRAELDLATSQLVLVDVKRDANKEPVVDSHGMYKFMSKQKKDSAYAMMYGNLACITFQFAMEVGLNVDESSSDDAAFVVGSI